MDVKVSSKYQIVIPKSLRKQLGIKAGQVLRIDSKNKKIILDTESVIDKYAGSLAGAWGKEDPAKAIRRMRDEDRA